MPQRKDLDTYYIIEFKLCGNLARQVYLFNHKETEIREVTNVIKPTQLNMAELVTGHPFFFFSDFRFYLFLLGLRHWDR